MPKTATPHTFVCCSSEGALGTELLLVKRLLIQKWAGGRSSDPVIPQWAGQWGFVCAPQVASQPIADTAYAAFLAQTGIDLKDPLVTKKYQIGTIKPMTLQDVDYNPVQVLYLVCQGSGMQALQTDIQGNIEARKIQDGVLETTIPRAEVFQRASQAGVPVRFLGGQISPEARRFDALASEVLGLMDEFTEQEEGHVEQPQRSLL